MEDVLAFLKRKLPNVRILGIMALVVFLAIASFIDVIRANELLFVVYKSVIFLSTLVFGLLLIETVLKEIRQREQIEKLAKEIQHSYELERKAYEVQSATKEQLENLDRTKNQFLLLIQHNLRTPLTSMMGYADLLLSGAFGKQSKKTIVVIKKFQSSTKNLIKMVNDFLDITQFQLGKDVLMLKEGISLKPILEEIVAELQEKADQKGIELKLEKLEKDVKIKADREKLKAAVLNIVDNSIKYTPIGGVTVDLQCKESAKIIIKDTGIGISSENVKTLFNRIFERGDVAKKTTVVGSGIGLYLASQIIKYHKGRIWAESEGEGKGATFYIELPLVVGQVLKGPGYKLPEESLPETTGEVIRNI